MPTLPCYQGARSRAMAELVKIPVFGRLSRFRGAPICHVYRADAGSVLLAGRRLQVSADADQGGGGFGGQLRRDRAAAGLTQEDLAERSGLSVRTISDLERGRISQPRRSTVRQLTRALSCSGPQGDEAAAAGARGGPQHRAQISSGPVAGSARPWPPGAGAPALDRRGCHLHRARRP